MHVDIVFVSVYRLECILCLYALIVFVFCIHVWRLLLARCGVISYMVNVFVVRQLLCKCVWPWLLPSFLHLLKRGCRVLCNSKNCMFHAWPINHLYLLCIFDRYHAITKDLCNCHPGPSKGKVLWCPCGIEKLCGLQTMQFTKEIMWQHICVSHDCHD